MELQPRFPVDGGGPEITHLATPTYSFSFWENQQLRAFTPALWPMAKPPRCCCVGFGQRGGGNAEPSSPQLGGCCAPTPCPAMVGAEPEHTVSYPPRQINLNRD